MESGSGVKSFALALLMMAMSARIAGSIRNWPAAEMVSGVFFSFALKGVTTF